MRGFIYRAHDEGGNCRRFFDDWKEATDYCESAEVGNCFMVDTVEIDVVSKKRDGNKATAVDVSVLLEALNENTILSADYKIRRTDYFYNKEEENK